MTIQTVNSNNSTNTETSMESQIIETQGFSPRGLCQSSAGQSDLELPSGALWSGQSYWDSRPQSSWRQQECRTGWSGWCGPQALGVPSTLALLCKLYCQSSWLGRAIEPGKIAYIDETFKKDRCQDFKNFWQCFNIHKNTNLPVGNVIWEFCKNNMCLMGVTVRINKDFANPHWATAVLECLLHCFARPKRHQCFCT